MFKRSGTAKYWLGVDQETLDPICRRALSNDAIEQVIIGPLEMDRLDIGSPYEFELVTIPIRDLDDEGLEKLSREGQLYLTLVEMKTIQAHFNSLEETPRTLNWNQSANLVRALQPQDFGGTHPLSGTRCQSGSPLDERQSTTCSKKRSCSNLTIGNRSRG